MSGSKSLWRKVLVFALVAFVLMLIGAVSVFDEFLGAYLLTLATLLTIGGIVSIAAVRIVRGIVRASRGLGSSEPEVVDLAGPAILMVIVLLALPLVWFGQYGAGALLD